MSNDNNKHDVPIAGHDYDGIQEFDNQLPRWWVQMFNLTIIFSIGYFGYYILGSGPTLFESYEKDAAQMEVLKANAPKAQGGGDAGEKLIALQKDPAQVEKGKTVYGAKCAACHGPAGQGTIGPNLTDNFWKHGGKLADILNTINKGVADKGMPPWGPLLSQDELYQVTVFVKSLKGTNPPNAKAPEGTETND